MIVVPMPIPITYSITISCVVDQPFKMPMVTTVAYLVTVMARADFGLSDEPNVSFAKRLHDGCRVNARIPSRQPVGNDRWRW